MGRIDPKYTTSVSVKGARQGHAVSDDGVLDVQLRTPKTNGVNEGTNPEQLFAAAWAGCFGGAIGGVGRAAGIDTSDATVTVEVSMGPDSDGGYGLAAKILVAIPGVEKDKVQELADAAHQTCPYSKATRGNVEVEVLAA